MEGMKIKDDMSKIIWDWECACELRSLVGPERIVNETKAWVSWVCVSDIGVR